MSGNVSSYLNAAATAANKTAPDNGVFGLRADAGNALMLDVRLRSGARLALPYSYLIFINFDPSTGIEAVFSSHAVTIQGRNLRPIYEGLLLHRVEWLQEGDPRHDPHPETATYITRIAVPATAANTR